MNSSEPGAPGAQTSGTRCIAFGDFRLDMPDRRVWRRDGTRVTLSPRLFDALLYLVEHAGELLDKDRLMATLWPGQVVEENNLNQMVLALRRALGDDGGDNRYILTVPRRGLRFVAPVRPVSPSLAPGVEINRAAPASNAAESGFASMTSLSAPSMTSMPSECAEPVPLAPSLLRSAHPFVQDGKEECTLQGVGTSLPRDTSAVSPANTPRRLVVLGGVAAVVAAGAFAARHWLASESTPPAPVPLTTLAVLPFKSLMEESRDEVLELGMADSLITRLSAARGIVVRSVGSVRRFSRNDTDPLRAARDLDVAWIVDGTVQRWGDRVRVTARLLNTADGVAAWSGTFDEPFTHMFDVQERISLRVADRLAPALSKSERAGVTAAGTQNAHAYQLFLAARYQSQLFTPDSFERSLALYQQAIAADPSYAYAYAGLADLYRRLPFTSNTAPRDAFEPARKAALRAIELDPRHSVGHAMLGWVKYWFDWDRVAAERFFRYALELNPSSSDAHLGLGNMLVTSGHTAQGVAELRLARETDPMSLIAHTLEGAALVMHGAHDEGVARIEHALAINPHFWIAHTCLGNVHLQAGRTQEALAALRRAVSDSRGSVIARSHLAYALTLTGGTDEAYEILHALVAQSQTAYVSPVAIALVLVALGQNTPALDWLDRAHTVRDLRLMYLQVEHRWLPLRAEPRFVALARNVSLSPLQPPQALTF